MDVTLEWIPEDEELYQAHAEEVGPEDFSLLAIYKAKLSLTKKAAGANLRDAEKAIRLSGIETITEAGSPELLYCTLAIDLQPESDKHMTAVVEIHHRTDTEYSRSQFQQAADRGFKTWLANLTGSNYVSRAQSA